MGNKTKTDYSDCAYLGLHGCGILKQTYCKTEPGKACAWYKSNKNRAAGIGRCASCKRRMKLICTVQYKRISPYKFCDCGKFERRLD